MPSKTSPKKKTKQNKEKGMETDVLVARNRVLSVKGKKVLHIDRNDHYGG